MKSSLFNTMLCASILVFAVGCGKDNKSGGGSASGTYWNGHTSPNSGLTNTSQQALTNLSTWYNNSIEGSALSGVVNKKKVQFTSTSAQENCVEKTFLGIPYTYCSSTSSGAGTGTVISQETVNLVTNNNVVINTKTNPELKAVFGTTLGTLLSASQQGNVFRLDFLRTTDNVVVSYIIDKSYHSLLNPVMKIEQSQTQYIQTTVQAVQIFN